MREAAVTVTAPPASAPVLPGVAEAPQPPQPSGSAPVLAAATTAPSGGDAAGDVETPPAPKAVKSYTDNADSFVVSVPATWKPGNAPPTRLAIVLTGPSALPDRKAPPIFRAQVGRPQPGQPQRSLDEFTREVIEQVTRKQPQSPRVAPTKVDGVEARQFTITLEDARSMDIDMKYVVCLRPSQSFIFTYLQERGLLDADEAERIFSSIRFLPAAASDGIPASETSSSSRP
jgi:hypothetical protein